MSGHFEFPHMFRWTAFIPRDGYPVHRKVTILYPHCDNNLMTRPGGGMAQFGVSLCVLFRFYETEGLKIMKYLKPHVRSIEFRHKNTY